jgi:hypothetical protein
MGKKDNIIKGNFGNQGAVAKQPEPVEPPTPPMPEAVAVDPESGRMIDAISGETLKLTEDQRKAIAVVLSGMSFVFVAIKPTDTGADFLTALHGDETDLRNAQDHLPAVIGRLYDRKGI